MKKLTLTILILFGTIQLAISQVDFGIKGGINYNLDNFEKVKDDVLSGAKSKTGYHAGIWARFDLGSLSARTELVYTELKSEADVKIPFLTTYKSKNLMSKGHFSLKKIDVPILLEINLMKTLYAYAGPSFQYIIGSDFDVNEFIKDKNNITNKFSAGLQTGLGVKFGHFGIDVRWERAFKDSEMEFFYKNIDKSSTSNIKFDHRVHQIIVSASYSF